MHCAANGGKLGTKLPQLLRLALHAGIDVLGPYKTL